MNKERGKRKGKRGKRSEKGQRTKGKRLKEKRNGRWRRGVEMKERKGKESSDKKERKEKERKWRKGREGRDRKCLGDSVTVCISELMSQRGQEKWWREGVQEVHQFVCDSFESVLWKISVERGGRIAPARFWKISPAFTSPSRSSAHQQETPSSRPVSRVASLRSFK